MKMIRYRMIINESAKQNNKKYFNEKEENTMATNNTKVTTLAKGDDLDSFINEAIDSLADHNERLEDLEQSVSTVIEDNENLVENSIWPMQDDIKKVGILSLIACGLSGLSILALLFRRK